LSIVHIISSTLSFFIYYDFFVGLIGLGAGGGGGGGLRLGGIFGLFCFSLPGFGVGITIFGFEF